MVIATESNSQETQLRHCEEFELWFFKYQSLLCILKIAAANTASP